MTHICVSKSITTGSDNGLAPGRREAIIWTNAGILLIRPLGTNFSDILIRVQAFSFKKMELKMSSVKWRPFCRGFNELRHIFESPLRNKMFWHQNIPGELDQYRRCWCRGLLRRQAINSHCPWYWNRSLFSTLLPAIACCQPSFSHYLIQLSLIIPVVLWHLAESNLRGPLMICRGRISCDLLPWQSKLRYKHQNKFPKWFGLETIRH